MNKVILTIAPTGNVPTLELSPFAAVTPQKIIEDLKVCEAAGAAVAHLHVRDMNKIPTSERKYFEELSKMFDESGLRMIKQFSTGARGGGMDDPNYRGQMLDLMPEMASLATGSSNFGTSINRNSPDLIRALALEMKKYNVKPEIEVFDAAMINGAKFLQKKGILEGNLHFNFVMNVPGSIPGTPKNLMFLVDSIPEGSTFNVSGIGKSQIQMLTMAIALGGHVRTGLEDVLVLDGEKVSNVQLVERIDSIAKAYGRPLATPNEAREILGLTQKIF